MPHQCPTNDEGKDIAGPSPRVFSSFVLGGALVGHSSFPVVGGALVIHKSPFFQFLDPVPDPGSLLVVLLGDELLELAAELGEFELAGLRPRQPARSLSGVLGVPVDTLQ